MDHPIQMGEGSKRHLYLDIPRYYNTNDGWRGEENALQKDRYKMYCMR